MMAVEGATIAGRFELGAKIGAGAFGQVFMGTDVQTGGEAAIKVESLKSSHHSLSLEASAYRLLALAKASKGFAAMHWFGVFGECRVMVSDLLGPSLQDLFECCGCRFSLKTVLSLGRQMLICIQWVHAAGLTHRDIKPNNFCIGLGEKARKVHLIDFGLSGVWLNPRTWQHIGFREGKRGPMGTACFASLNAHARAQQSRRDDLESLGYVLLYFLRGELPWQRRGPHEILSVKRSTSVRDLCEQQPPELADFVRYCRGLGWADRPDYSHLHGLLRATFVREGCCGPPSLVRVGQPSLARVQFDWTELRTNGREPRLGGRLGAAGEKHQAITTLPLDSDKATLEDADL